jgi:ATP-dependent Zn protease
LLLLAQAQPEESSQDASIFMKLFYTLLPLFVIGLLLFFFFRRIQPRLKQTTQYMERHEQHMESVEQSLERIARALERKDKDRA